MKKIVAASLTSMVLLAGFAESTNAAKAGQITAASTVVQSAQTNQQNTQSTFFSDIPHNFWAYREIAYLKLKNIVEPLSANNYAPNEKITRADAAKMLAKALNLDINNPDYKEIDFPDVPAIHVDYDYIKAVFNENIFKGQDDGKFGINQPLTRAQMAKVLVETFNLSGDYPLTFRDVSSKHWAVDFIDKLAASEVTNGYHDLTYKPNNHVTRAQMAAFIYRAMVGSPFDDPNIYDYFGGFGPHNTKDDPTPNGVILFGSYGEFENYLPSDKLNPYINRQVYQVTKSLLDPNFYVTTQLMDVADFGKRVKVAIGNTDTANALGNHFIAYFLNDERYASYGTKPLASFSDTPVIRLDLRLLWFDIEKVDKKTFTEPVYTQKLKDSLMSLFPNGEEIYQYVLAKYIEDHTNKKDILETKRIGNMQLDVDNSGMGISVKFTYL